MLLVGHAAGPIPGRTISILRAVRVTERVVCSQTLGMSERVFGEMPRGRSRRSGLPAFAIARLAVAPGVAW
ncbi:MAG: hypothetical protein K0S65_3574 [Labilithrix sp.]|nr:hypothetical protein [Labilithrix sp.]